MIGLVFLALCLIGRGEQCTNELYCGLWSLLPLLDYISHFILTTTNVPQKISEFQCGFTGVFFTEIQG